MGVYMCRWMNGAITHDTYYRILLFGMKVERERGRGREREGRWVERQDGIGWNERLEV